MGWFLLPFDNLLCIVLGISFTVGFSSLLVIVVPAVLGVSIGIRRLYMKSLLKVFEWATVRMERGAKEKNQHLYKPYSNGIIAKELSSLEQEIQELRASGTTLSSEPEFEMADIMYFCRRGVESIVDDEVTKRFSAQELESWNLLTRSNFNARHISLRLSVLWGLGLFIRYGFLLPLRVTLAASGIGLLVVLTTIVGFIPSGWLRTYLSEKIHLMSYRICVRSLTAIITYHNRYCRPTKCSLASIHNISSDNRDTNLLYFVTAFCPFSDSPPYLVLSSKPVLQCLHKVFISFDLFHILCYSLNSANVSTFIEH
ncbi:unnamed protein product [Oncorhynchus mykiss]|uniref:Glycerol-3-phosphate acyltransferase 4 n=1 Tax=Oncorhynchus mykiss TaxID=8022 RepID=A0A060VVT0_ONCMY|nr:unnamed protein product [Oncorhynchus mykiss]